MTTRPPYSEAVHGAGPPLNMGVGAEVGVVAVGVSWGHCAVLGWSPPQASAMNYRSWDPPHPLSALSAVPKPDLPAQRALSLFLPLLRHSS